ncbi:uncharacterized protein TNCV_2803691 [Trichonephila clavipes]|nr:uncharacterized protein TNCV_2803691 [Trichonephila clavipes]
MIKEKTFKKKTSLSDRKIFYLLKYSPEVVFLHMRSIRGLLATDHVILNHGQVTWTTPELAPHTNVSALDRVNVHRSPTRQVFSGTGLELVTRPATIRYFDHSATAASPQLAPCHLTNGRTLKLERFNGYRHTLHDGL